jgi:hypothetical protein
MMLMIDGYESSINRDSYGKVFDYSESNEPRCQKAWNKAVTAYALLQDKPEVLQYQIEISAKKLFENVE